MLQLFIKEMLCEQFLSCNIFLAATGAIAEECRLKTPPDNLYCQLCLRCDDFRKQSISDRFLECIIWFRAIDLFANRISRVVMLLCA